MPSLCDINFLVPVCYEGHKLHRAATNWLSLQTGFGEFAVCRSAQLGLLRLLNNPASMKTDVLTVPETWRVYDALMKDERFYFVAEPAALDLDLVLRRAMQGQTYAPKLWQDAYLAAFAIATGLSLVTFDAAFRQFRDLNLVLLA